MSHDLYTGRPFCTRSWVRVINRPRLCRKSVKYVSNGKLLLSKQSVINDFFSSLLMFLPPRDRRIFILWMASEITSPFPRDTFIVKPILVFSSFLIGTQFPKTISFIGQALRPSSNRKRFVSFFPLPLQRLLSPPFVSSCSDPTILRRPLHPSLV